MSRREIQVSETIAHLAAQFIERESNHESLITVTRADMSPDLKRVMIFISVLPEKFEEPALAFVKRMRNEFRDYIKKHTRSGILPHIDFEIDYGEKNRQRIDDLTRK